MPVYSIDSTQQSAEASTSMDWGQIAMEVMPYALGLVVFMILAYIAYKLLKGGFKQGLKDYDAEAQKRIFNELRKRPVRRGWGSTLFAAFLAFLGLGVGGGISYLLKLDLMMAIAVTVATFIMWWLGGVVVANFLQRWLEKCSFVYDKDMNRFGIVASRPYKTEDGIQYVLVKRGVKWLFFADFSVLNLPLATKFQYQTLNLKGEKELKTAEFAKLDDAFFMNDSNDYIVNCMDFQQHGKYFYPVLKFNTKTKTKKGKVIAEKELFSFRDIAFAINKRITDELTMYDLAVEQQRNAIVLASANPYTELGQRSDTKIKKAGGVED